MTGRPPKFTDPADMAEGIEAYFATCDEEHRPYTIAGLAYFLGFEDRHGVAEYEKKGGFSATVKKARLRIEQQRSEQLVSATGNVTGKIFDLKNNFGWRDQQDLTHSGPNGGPINYSNMTEAEIDARLAELTRKMGDES